MIHIDDQTPLTERKYNLVIPIDIICYADGTSEIFVYEMFEETAVALEADFGGRLISKEAIDFIHGSLRDRVAEYEYEADSDSLYDYMEIYSIPDGSKINETLIQQTTENLTDGSGGYQNLTSLPIGEDITFGTVIDGKIVSAATLNPHEEGDIMPEITVETAKGCEGRGYGKSNTAAIAKFLLENGYGGSFNCMKSNPASAAIAKSVGFSYDAAAYYYVCYEIER